MLNGLSLFSGIGGLDVSLSEWCRPIAYCEIDPYCQGVLLSRIHSGELPMGRIWSDIKTFPICGFDNQSVDILYGGSPCQDFSIAGHGKGLEGERSGLFFEMLRIIQKIEPPWVFLENVPAITSRGGSRVVQEITSLGYDCRWCVIPASEWVDQRRERWFYLAKLNGIRRDKRPIEGIQSPRETIQHEKPSNYKLSSMECWGAFARSVRKDNGIPFRMERVKALGNSVCPQQAKEAFKILMGLK